VSGEAAWSRVTRAWRWALGSTPLGARELVLGGVLLAAAGAAVYYPHVLHGGFYSDDWSLSTFYRLPTPDYGRAVDVLDHILGARPLLARLQPVSHALFGLDFRGHLALAALLGVLTSTCLFAFLRVTELEPLHALAVAGLALIYPWSDGARLWTTGSVNQVALCLGLAGAAVALRGLSARSRRAVALHVLALVLYAGAVLTYESVGPLLLLAGVLYVIRTSWRAAWPRWTADVLVVGSLLAWSRAKSAEVRFVPSVDQVLDDVAEFLRQAWSVVGLSVRPFLVTPAVPIAAVAVLLLLLVLRFPREPAARRALFRWLTIAGGALVALVAAWAPFLGSTLHPLDTGINGRVNMVAGPALVLCVYSLAGAAGVLACRGRWRAWAPAVPLATAAVLAAGYAYRVRGDIVLWDRAAAMQADVLRAIDRALPARPPAGTTIYTYGHAADLAPGIPIFSVPWDLQGAIQSRYDASDHAYPLVVDAHLVCTARTVYPVAAPHVYGVLGGGYGPAQGAVYGRAVVIDVRTARARPIADRGSCRQAAAAVQPGPIILQFP
jgi:hypothetical protein